MIGEELIYVIGSTLIGTKRTIEEVTREITYGWATITPEGEKELLEGICVCPGCSKWSSVDDMTSDESGERKCFNCSK